ncbi:macrophage mannose receptor 1-like [Saccostrea echinata]|uniref:macrophage mannose receptor 1-like n=1 Tax=Saccostrea echinata TaxID=191078 RepID=UPI002A830840|nr:macrophage mannose receptor 1-like [Saccostrea echinata]
MVGRHSTTRRQADLLILVLLVSQILPVTYTQSSVIQTLLVTAAISQFTSNAGFTELSIPQLLAVAFVTAVINQPQTPQTQPVLGPPPTPPFYCDAYPTYTYDASVHVCYRTVKEPRLSVTNADAACKADGPDAQLIRISNPAVYSFVVSQIDQFGISNMYFQGSRANSWSPFLYDDGTPVTYFNWDTGEPGSNNYLRTDTSTRLMETSSGSSSRSYICAVYP